jgi:hypothetical protein
MFGIDIPIWSALFGSLSGIIGHWFTSKEEKDKREHEAKMFKLKMDRDKLNSELAIAEIEANLKVVETQTEGALLQEEAKGFNKVVESLNKNLLSSTILKTLLDGKWYTPSRFFGVMLAVMFGLVDVIRGLVRPALTICAFTFVGYMANVLGVHLEMFDDEKKLALLAMLVDAIIYVLTAATQFWFMDRAGARDFRKKH